MKTGRILLICGIVAPVLYAITVVVGGILQPSYDPVQQTISELIARGAPYKSLLDALFVVYNLFIILFGVGMMLANSLWRLARTASMLLILIGVLGVILTVFFPLDALGSPQSFTGTMHLVVSGLLSLFTILTLLLFGLGWRRQIGFHALGLYSMASALAVIITGGSTVLGGRAYMGLAERLTIGAYLQWVFVVALVLTLLFKRLIQGRRPETRKII